MKLIKNLGLFSKVTFWLAIVLVSVPTIVAVFLDMPYTLYAILNTIGILLATIHIVGALAVGISITAVKGERSDLKVRFDNQTKILFIMMILFQLINFMFVQSK